MIISKTVKDAWQANNRVNLALLEHLTPKMLEARTPGGGFTVAQQLAHITGTVKFWGMQLDDVLESLPDLFDPNSESFTAESDIERISAVRTQTAQSALDAAGAAEDKGKLPHSSPEAYLVHMMVHDAHHRGQILLALKTAGHPLPDEALVWGPWRGE